MIKAVLFDYGGVLSEGGGKHSLTEIIASLYGFEVGWDKLAAVHDQLRCGRITTEAFFKELAAIHHSSKVVTVAEWDKASEDVFKLSVPVISLAVKLRKQGIKTGIVSNVYAMTADRHRQLGNYNGFDSVVLSCEAGEVKPDPKIYELALSKLGVEPSEVLLVDDQEKCLPPAQALGMHTISATSPAQIVADVMALVANENGGTA